MIHAYALGLSVLTIILLKVIKMLTHLHMGVYTLWCWQICKGEEVGEVSKNLEFKKRSDGSWIRILLSSVMLWINMHVGCVSLCISF